eukprot:Sdes_comp16534_c1_seq1m5848
MSSANITQDLPPKNGFPDIQYKRINKRVGPSGAVLFVGCLCMMAGGMYVAGQGNLQRRKEKLEKTQARLMLVPLLQAEEDRRYLKRLKEIQEEERIIMKDVPGWDFNDKIYHTDRFVPPPRNIQYGPQII